MDSVPYLLYSALIDEALKRSIDGYPWVLGISLVSYNMPRGLSDDCLIFSGNGKRR